MLYAEPPVPLPVSLYHLLHRVQHYMVGFIPDGVAGYLPAGFIDSDEHPLQLLRGMNGEPTGMGLVVVRLEEEGGAGTHGAIGEDLYRSQLEHVVPEPGAEAERGQLFKLLNSPPHINADGKPPLFPELLIGGESQRVGVLVNAGHPQALRLLHRRFCSFEPELSRRWGDDPFH